MSKNLVIVESPAKAKTIEGYLGKDFVVKSSFGHVRDLPKGNGAIDVKNGFLPTYEVTADKKQVVSDLKKSAKEAETVWLATDDDREGEAISWHLYETLGLDEKKTKRIVFREITKNAILNAISNPRTIDIDLVNAQQARRVLDRLVGFELSPVLWKKIKRGLSAGRVQSVAVRLIVDREREVEQFKSKFTYRVTAKFTTEKNKVVLAKLPKDFPSEEKAYEFAQKCINAGFSVANLEKKDGKRSPAAPFTTSTLQQEASRKLGFSVAQTMIVAQKLYESGKITYMRTDSVNLSDTAIAAAKAEIESAYGSQYSFPRKYATKSASAQEAHEAIRPTDFAVHKLTSGEERNQMRLYELIWKRAISSQMADALIEKTTVSIAISTTNEILESVGEIIRFEGFLKVYLESQDDEHDDDLEDEDKTTLPPLVLGQPLNLEELKAAQTFSRPLPRYTEASLVKKLEELGIGRPSTYAPTISTIQKREYVIKENRDGKQRPMKEIVLKSNKVLVSTKTETYGTEKNKLFPTDLAMIVNDFLVSHFTDIVDFGFTAQAEKEFDDIAEGKLNWQTMLSKFYDPFHQKVEITEGIDRKEVSTARDLGLHPDSGLKMTVRLGRYGPFVQVGEADGDTKPLSASLKKGQLIENITLAEALELFKLPRTLGNFEDKTVVAAIGRFGPYIRHDSSFYSIPKDEDPLVITIERALELIQGKRKADAEKTIKSFEEDATIKVLNGRYGPYISGDGKNVKIPKGKEPSTLTFEECKQLITEAPEAKKKTFAKKKATPKK